jgi:FixJ family two-component response regulator
MKSKNLQTSPSLSLLLLDDDPAFARSIIDCFAEFKERSSAVKWEKSVESALSAIRNQEPLDIIIMDYIFQSSNTNGLDFCLALNQMEKQIPIVFVSSVSDIQLAVEVMKLGVEEFILKKEVVFSDFPKKILTILERTQLRRQRYAVEKRIALAENKTQAVRELVVTICHEFNNPLAAVKISYDLLRRLLSSEKDRLLLQKFEQHYLQIETEIRRLRDLNFERIDFHRS